MQAVMTGKGYRKDFNACVKGGGNEGCEWMNVLAPP